MPSHIIWKLQNTNEKEDMLKEVRGRKKNLTGQNAGEDVE